MPGVGRNSYKAAMKKAKAKTKKKTPLRMEHAKKKNTRINNNKPLTAAQKARIKKQKEQMAKSKKEGKPGTGLLNPGPRRLKPKSKSRR